MRKTIIALYDDMATANTVVDGLVAAGIDRASVMVDQGENLTVTRTDADMDRGGFAGFFDRLFGLNVPENDVEVYAESVRRGGVVVTATVDETYLDTAQSVMGQYSPIDLDERNEYYRSSGWTGWDNNAPLYGQEEIVQDRDTFRTSHSTGTDYSGTSRTLEAGEEARLDVVEEELRVGKRAVEGGGMRIRTYVTETPVSEQVTLRQEHATVERHAVDRAATSADLDAFQEGVIEVTEYGEEAVVSKTARVVEEVVIGKTAEERTETITDTVRRKDVDVEQIDRDMNRRADVDYTTTSTTSSSDLLDEDTRNR